MRAWNATVGILSPPSSSRCSGSHPLRGPRSLRRRCRQDLSVSSTGRLLTRPPTGLSGPIRSPPGSVQPQRMENLRLYSRLASRILQSSHAEWGTTSVLDARGHALGHKRKPLGDDRQLVQGMGSVSKVKRTREGCVRPSLRCRSRGIQPGTPVMVFERMADRHEYYRRWVASGGCSQTARLRTRRNDAGGGADPNRYRS